MSARRRMTVAAVALLVVLASAIAVVLRRGGADEGDDADDRLVGAAEVFLEPATDPGPGPFAEGVAGDADPLPVARPDPTATTTPAGAAATGERRTVDGTAPGLYGAARGVPTCDVELLADVLGRDPDVASSWARAAGVPSAGIGDYLASLTPVVLRGDTRVTDYVLRGGTAQARQAVLEAGTSVLVDAFGAPAVRCASGSPVQAPEPARAGAEYSGQRWDGFAPERTLVVQRGPARVNEFVIVDLAATGYFTRPAGTPSTAPADEGLYIDRICDLFPEECARPDLAPPAPGAPDLAIELTWFSTADLDLAVTDPTGATVRYDSPSVATGGGLSADVNGACRVPTSAAAETVTWPTGTALPGAYTITVTYYDTCPGGAGAQPYVLDVSGANVDLGSGALGGFRMAVAAAPATGGMLSAPGDSATSTALVGIPPAVTPPGPVLNLTAEVVGDVVDVNWTLNEDPSFGPATSIVITQVIVKGSRPGVTHEFRAEADIDGAEFADGEPGAVYTLVVEAENGAGRSMSSSVTVTIPGVLVSPEPPTSSTTTLPAPLPTTPPTTPPTPDALTAECNRLYGPPPPPNQEATNPSWALCMHDPTSDEVVGIEAVPASPEVPGG